MASKGVAGGIDRELPGDGRAFGIAVANPGEDFVLELSLVGDAAVQALTTQGGKLDLDLSWAKQHLPGLPAY